MNTQKFIATITAGIMLSVWVNGGLLVRVDGKIVAKNGKIVTISENTTTTTTQGWPAYPIWRSSIMISNNAPAPVTVSASTELNTAFKAADTNYATYWQTTDSAFPHWWKYDCGVGQSNVLVQVAFRNFLAYGINAFTVNGSLNDSDYTTLITGNGVDNAGNLLQVFSNGASMAFYRYFKFNITSGYDGDPGYILLREVDLSSAEPFPAMTGNTNAPYIVTADSQYNSTYPAWKAFDRDIETLWSTTVSAFPHWIQFYSVTNYVVSAFSIRNVINVGFSNFTFTASSNGTDWTTLNTATAKNEIAIQLFTNDNSTAYSYYRLTATSGFSTYAQLYEVRLFSNR